MKICKIKFKKVEVDTIYIFGYTKKYIDKEVRSQKGREEATITYIDDFSTFRSNIPFVDRLITDIDYNKSEVLIENVECYIHLLSILKLRQEIDSKLINILEKNSKLLKLAPIYDSFDNVSIIGLIKERMNRVSILEKSLLYKFRPEIFKSHYRLIGSEITIECRNSLFFVWPSAIYEQNQSDITRIYTTLLEPKKKIKQL